MEFARAALGLIAIVCLSACAGEPADDGSISVSELLENGERYDRQTVWVHGFFYDMPNIILCSRSYSLKGLMNGIPKKCIGFDNSVRPIGETLNFKNGDRVTVKADYSRAVCGVDALCWWERCKGSDCKKSFDGEITESLTVVDFSQSKEEGP